MKLCRVLSVGIVAACLSGLFAAPATAAPSGGYVKISGAVRFTNIVDGFDTSLEIAAQCMPFSSCYSILFPTQAPRGHVRVTQRVGDTERTFSMVPACIVFGVADGAHTNLATMSGPAVDRDGSFAGTITIGVADFSDGRHPATGTDVPYLDRAWMHIEPGSPPEPFCPNALRHAAAGLEVSAGNITIREADPT